MKFELSACANWALRIARLACNAVVPAADLMTTVMAKAKILAAKPPGALRATKALLRGDGVDVNARIQKEVTLFSAHLDSPEFKEAASAFLEKRPADFSKLG